MKKCSKCKQIKDTDNFHLRDKSDRRRSWCKGCLAEYKRDRHKKLNPKPIPPTDTKWCKDCKKYVAIKNFGTVNRNGKVYLTSYCKNCSTHRLHLWREENPQGVRRQELKRLYGMTLVEYNELLVKQSGRCAICGTADPTPRSGFCVDHDHLTGKVRGLLCSHCNSALGFFRDSSTACLNAAKYLDDSHKEGVV